MNERKWMLVKAVILGSFLWILAAQDVLKSLEDDTAIDYDAGQGIQKFYNVAQYKSILATAPILAETRKGFPALNLGTGTPEVVTPIVNEVLSPVSYRPPTRWENLPVVSTPLDVLGLMTLPVIAGTFSLRGVTTLGDLAYSARAEVKVVDCSATGAAWLDSRFRTSLTQPYFTENDCRGHAEASCTSDDCSVRFAYGKGGNCMPCAQLDLTSTSTERDAQHSSNSDSKVITWERHRPMIGFTGRADVTTPDSVPVFTVAIGAASDLRLGHIFEYRPVFLVSKTLKDVAKLSTVKGDEDQCRQKAVALGAKAYTFKDDECTFYGTGTGKVKPAGLGFEISTDARLQLRRELTLVGVVPSPQRELSGTTTFGKFIWRGKLHDAQEVQGLRSIEKRKSSATSKTMTLISFSHARNCEKAPILAIKDDLREIGVGVVKDRGYMTPLTRNLHLGVGTALITEPSRLTGEVRFYVKDLPKGLCYRKPKVRQPRSSEKDADDDDIAFVGSCDQAYHFAVAAYACDLHYIPLGRGVATEREYRGDMREGSSQSVILHKARKTPLGTAVQAIVLGFSLGDDVHVPNMTKFGTNMGRVRKEGASKRKRMDTEATWVDDAQKFRSINKIQWNEFLSWLSYSSQSAWAASVRADEAFDLYTFATPVLFGFLLVTSLTISKYVAAPELANVVGGASGFMSLVLIFAIIWYYDLPFSQSAGGMAGAVCAIAFGVQRSYGTVKVSDGELLGAWLTLVFCYIKACAHDPLTSRVIGYTLDLLLVVKACVVLPSGRRMATSAIIVRATVAYLDSPFEVDQYRSGHFTFFSSLASALNLEALATESPMSYFPLFARVDVFAKLALWPLSRPPSTAAWTPDELDPLEKWRSTTLEQLCLPSGRLRQGSTSMLPRRWKDSSPSSLSTHLR